MRITKISICRILGMFLILACHLCLGFFHSSIGYVFNVGVPLFLFISGCLYGQKDIHSPMKWYARRFFRVCIPMYIFVITVWLIVFFVQKSHVDFPFVFIVNLQGLSNILLNTEMPFTVFADGIGHLWFLTIIMICYIIVIFLKKIESNVTFRKIRPQYVLAVLCILQIGFAYLGLQTINFITFIAGYFTSKYDFKIDAKRFVIVTIVMSLGLAVRLLAKNLFDSSVIYDNVIVAWTQAILAFWIYALVDFVLGKLPEMETFLRESMILRKVDALSYYVYITHYVFVKEPFSVGVIVDNPVVQTLLVFAFSFVSAVLLKIISEFIIRKFNKLV